MAAKLVITFADADGKNAKMSYSSADAEASDVRAAVQTIITNGSIFATVPVSAKSAKMVITTENEISLSA